MKEQRIVCAANRYMGRIIICGARHFDMVMHGVLEHLIDLGREEQGFIDNNGEFHNRAAAFRIATKAGQIRHKTGNPNSNELFSEDLY